MPEFDFDYEQEKMYNPDRTDTSRYDQAQMEYEDSRDYRNNPRVTGVSGRTITEAEWSKYIDR